MAKPDIEYCEPCGACAWCGQNAQNRQIVASLKRRLPAVYRRLDTIREILELVDPDHEDAYVVRAIDDAQRIADSLRAAMATAAKSQA